MGAKILYWMKLNQAFVTGFAIGIIAGGFLGMLGAYLAGVR